MTARDRHRRKSRRGGSTSRPARTMKALRHMPMTRGQNRGPRCVRPLFVFKGNSTGRLALRGRAPGDHTRPGRLACASSALMWSSRVGPGVDRMPPQQGTLPALWACGPPLLGCRQKRGNILRGVEHACATQLPAEPLCRQPQHRPRTDHGDQGARCPDRGCSTNAGAPARRADREADLGG